MAEEPGFEGKAGVGRIEAFSDGVLAIIITIMVLELHAPEEPGLAALWHLWPTLFAYVLSFSYVGIYWINHHRMFSHARLVTPGLLWANMALLFALSLLPFSTAYLGQHLTDPLAAIIYNLSLLLPGIAYYWVERVVRATGSQTVESITYYRATMRKGVAALVAYFSAMVISIWSPALGLTLPGVVALFWIVPWGPLDRLFLRCDEAGSS